jgi:hypothetical protein
MHAHRSAGHPVPSADPPEQPPWSDRVRGLGVSDALQLQLEPLQVPWLRDELEELRLAHEQGLVEAVQRRGSATGSDVRRIAAEDIDRHRHDLAVLRAVCAQIPASADRHVVVCGPAPMLSGIIRGVTASVAERLAELVGERQGSRAAATADDLVALAAATQAWVETLAACHALEWFTFDVEPMAMEGEEPESRH